MQIHSGSRVSARIWESPIYQFAIPEGTGVRPYQFNVTQSASRVLTDASVDLAAALRWAIEMTGKSNPRILDFGAGRLRNTLHLLRRGHSVTAVEFGQLSNSESVLPFLNEARGFGSRFSELIFPHQFLQSSARFDLIIIVNVINIMPVPAERYLAVQYCRDKLADDGLIFWYSQTTQSIYKDKPPFGDGLIADPNVRVKTFYKDFTSEQVDELFAANGLRLKGEQYPMHNRCKLYKKAGENPTKRILSAEKIRRYVGGDGDYPTPAKVLPDLVSRRNMRANVPEPPQLRRSQLYSEALRRLPAGRDDRVDKTYQNLVGAIFLHLFERQLVKMQFEADIHEGRGIIDIVFRNHATSGFFSRFPLIHDPFVYVECKNLSRDLPIRDIDQSIQRVSTTKSHLGIIVCRRNRNQQLIRDRCKDATDENKLVFWLEDSEIHRLLENYGSPANIDEVLLNRVDEVTST